METLDGQTQDQYIQHLTERRANLLPELEDVERLMGRNALDALDGLGDE